VSELKVAINAGSDGVIGPEAWSKMADFVCEAERLGVAFCWTAEAWGSDAVSPVGYLAAKTDRIRLGAGIMQVYNRTPASMAMTALTLAAMSGNRFVLGIGASGPQVVEGLHGQRFERPLRRIAETIEIVRRAFAGERVVFEGEVFRLPLLGSQGKALRLAFPPNDQIPIYLATLSPKALAEDAVQEACAAALVTWPISGTPTNPCAWLIGTARQRARHADAALLGEVRASRWMPEVHIHTAAG